MGIIHSYYTIKVVINPLDMKHGQDLFDKRYYRRFFKDYSKNELLMYYRWSLGWIRFLDRYLPLKNGRGKKVLEIGCSIGAFAKVLKERGFGVWACDVSSYIIKKACLLQKDVKFFVQDAQEPIKAAGNFDYIFAFEALEHLNTPGKALNNIFKKLKKDGVFIFSTPFPTKRALSDPTHINVHFPNWWLGAGKKAGFSKRELKHATFIPYLYRLSSLFSKGFSLKTDIPMVNSTCFFIFKK